eukprot:2521260-Pleurochrysis_carterae.AAC.1
MEENEEERRERVERSLDKQTEWTRGDEGVTGLASRLGPCFPKRAAALTTVSGVLSAASGTASADWYAMVCACGHLAPTPAHSSPRLAKSAMSLTLHSGKGTPCFGSMKLSLPSHSSCMQSADRGGLACLTRSADAKTMGKIAKSERGRERIWGRGVGWV